MKRLLIRLFAIFVTIGPAAALEPERREAVVINGRVWEGFAYREMLLPSSMNTLTLMAGRDSAITFARTQEYYWPLSRQVYVDFERQRDELAGVLRIEQDGQVVGEIARSSFSIVYPKGAINGDGRLLWGQAAADAYQAYQDEEKAFARRFVEAQRAHTAYEHALLEAGAARKRGEPVAHIPVPPPLPEPSLRLVTKPVPGYRVELAPGTYQISLLAEGAPIPGSMRLLRVVDVRGRRTVVADIIPEERWTKPLASNTEATRVFARPGSIFYVTLAEADRFDEAEYIPVVTPQSEAVAGRSLWVRRKPSDADSISLSWTGVEGARNVSLTRLKVEQTQGSGFGYRVRNAREGEKEDLKAFVIPVPTDQSGTRGLITLEDTGQQALTREVVVVQPRNTTVAFALALLPVLLWSAWRMSERLGGRKGHPWTGSPAL